MSEVHTEDIDISTTVPSDELKKIPKRNGSQMLEESELTDIQKKLALHMYEVVSNAIKTILTDISIDNAFKVTLMIGQLIKHLENAKSRGHLVTGEDKKTVAIELGRILIKEFVTDENKEKEILVVYDVFADKTLEAMIDVSKVVNVVAEHVATQCCPGLLAVFKKSSKNVKTIELEAPKSV